MSAPAELRDGPYDKLIDEDGPYERASPSSGLNLGPSPSPSPGPGLYRAAVMALAALCVILLIAVIAVSHKQKEPVTGEESPPQRQTQEFNVSELQSVIVQLRQENNRLWEQINATKEVQATTPPPPKCPIDWLPFNSSCYLVSRRTRSWSDAHEYCVSQGAHLAIILTAEEQSFVWDQLPRGHWNAYWIGITDSQTEDQWHWVDGTPLVGGFWEEGEPNNHIDEDCGYIVKTRVLTRVAIRSWYDAPCSMSWPFVCEKELGSGIAEPTVSSH